MNWLYFDALKYDFFVFFLYILVVFSKRLYLLHLEGQRANAHRPSVRNIVRIQRNMVKMFFMILTNKGL